MKIKVMLVRCFATAAIIFAGTLSFAQVTAGSPAKWEYDDSDNPSRECKLSAGFSGAIELGANAPGSTSVKDLGEIDCPAPKIYVPKKYIKRDAFEWYRYLSNPDLLKSCDADISKDEKKLAKSTRYILGEIYDYFNLEAPDDMTDIGANCTTAKFLAQWKTFFERVGANKRGRWFDAADWGSYANAGLNSGTPLDIIYGTNNGGTPILQSAIDKNSAKFFYIVSKIALQSLYKGCRCSNSSYNVRQMMLNQTESNFAFQLNMIEN